MKEKEDNALSQGRLFNNREREREREQERKERRKIGILRKPHQNEKRENFDREREGISPKENSH